MTKILHLAARLDASWQGDLIGALCLFVGGYGLTWAIGCLVGM